MLVARGFSLLCALAIAAPVAVAQPKSAVTPLVGATEVISLTTPTGFIDDAVAADGDRVAYVVADAASRAELHVVTLSTKQDVVVDLAKVTLHPVALQLVGQRAFVVGRLEDGKQIAALVELAAKGKRPAGTVVYKIAPADHITLIARDGKQRVAVHRTAATKVGTRHDVELVAIETGRRIAPLRSLELDAAGTNKQLDFRVNHWTEGYTRAHGIKAGAWDRKEDQRSPDSEASYDLIKRKVEKWPMQDLFEQRRRFQTLADAGGRGDFFRVNWDNTGLQVWDDARPKAVELDQAFATYDPKSLLGEILADGSAWIVLKTDPVNAAAVARKKADPEYVDVFRMTADGKATRKARILAPGARHRFGIVVGDANRFWLVERNQGFERGGKRLTVYQLQ